MGTFRILSIDGGGMRGIIPLQILKRIELLTGKPIYNSFDLIAGTSTGGLLACAMTLTTKESGERLYTLDELENIYLQHGRTIFPKRFLKKPKALFFPKYSHKGLESILEKYLKDFRIDDCVKPILVSSYDIKNNIPFYFRSRDIYPISPSYSVNKNYKLKDVCRATSAAPTYFPTHYMRCHSIETDEMRYRNLIDGGVFVNNPALLSVLEAINHRNLGIYNGDGKKEIDYKNIFVLSLGTGNLSAEDEISKENGGQIGWAKPVIDIMMQGSSQIADGHLKVLLNGNYKRVNIDIDKKYSELDNSNKNNLQTLKEEVNRKLLNNNTWLVNFENFLRTAKMV